MGEKTIFFAVAVIPPMTDAEKQEAAKRMETLNAAKVPSGQEATIENIRKLIDIPTPFIIHDNTPAYINFCKWSVDENSLTPKKGAAPIVLSKQKVRDKNGITANFSEQTIFCSSTPISEQIVIRGKISASFCGAAFIVEQLNAYFFSKMQHLSDVDAASKVAEIQKLLQDKILDKAELRGKTEKRFFMLLKKKCADLIGKWEKPEQPAKIQNAIISATQRALVERRDFPEIDTTAATIDALNKTTEEEKQLVFFAVQQCNGIKTSLLICLGAMLYNHPEWVEVTKDKAIAHITITPQQLLSEMGFNDTEYMIQKIRKNADQTAQLSFVADRELPDGRMYHIAGSPFIFQEQKTRTKKEGSTPRRWTFTLATEVYLLPGMEKLKGVNYLKILPGAIRYINSHATNLPAGETAVNIATMIIADMARRKVDDVALDLFGYEPPTNRMALSRFKKQVVPLIIDGIKSIGGIISITQDLKVTAYFPVILAELKEKSDRLKAKKQREQKEKPRTGEQKEKQSSKNT